MVKWESKSRVIFKKLNGGFSSFDIFILLFEKSHVGRHIQPKINLVSPTLKKVM